MPTFFQRPLTTIALCWRIERRDGVTLGFTSHDRNLQIDGLNYRAEPGMLPSAIAQTDGFDADALDVTGALTSDAIRAADLLAGRWDDAAVAIFMVDWTAPDDEHLLLAWGELGEVSIQGEEFEAELRSAVARLDVPVVEQTSPECRATLGDKRCRVDMAAHSHLTRITGIVDADVFDVAEATGGPAYNYGRIRWIDGANSGLESAVLHSDGRRLTLREAPPFPVMVGNLVALREGCDRSPATCQDRFGNIRNFRGEPHLPGFDLLTRYPGA